MRIVIDLQAAQAAHRFQQIGRDALALALAIARQRGHHQVIIALNGAFADTIDALRAAFAEILVPEDVRVWHGSIQFHDAQSGHMAAYVREAFLAALAPDLLFVMNVFEGFADAAETSANTFIEGIPTAVLIHDLAPWREPSLLLKPVPGLEKFYQEKVQQFGRAAQWLSLDPESAANALSLLGIPVSLLNRHEAGAGQARWDEIGASAVAAFEAMPPAVLAPVDAGTLLGRLVERMPAEVTWRHKSDQAPRWAHQLSKFPVGQKRQLFVDITVMVQHDARTGVQRVTRSVLKHLLENPPDGFEVAPVYGVAGQASYRYARSFTARFQEMQTEENDAPIDYQGGDVFLGLDLSPYVLPQMVPFLQALRRDGVRIYSVVYDLLPVLMPQHFPPNTDESHAHWLRTVLSFDGAICISRAVAWELAQWGREYAPPGLRPCEIGWFHLGADVDGSVPSRGMPDGAIAMLAQLAQRPTLLAVGTVEPRKQYGQILDAFELLWRDGIDANIVIVGKQGWMMEDLVARIRQHAENGNRLFWFAGISDEFLTKVYGAASGLIAASTGEGFGLPLIEAARHRLPVIARDLPVFREVGGEHAYYFSGLRPDDLASALASWLELLATSGVPASEGMPSLTWQESTRQLMQVVLNQPGRAAQLLDPAPEQVRARPRMLMLVPFPIRRPRHGGQLRAAAMVQVHEAAGFDVHVVGFYQAEAYEAADIGPFDIPFPPDSPFRRYLDVHMPSMSDFLMGPFSVDGDGVFRQVCSSLQGTIDVIQLEQPWLYPLACWLRLQSPECRNALVVNSTNNIEAEMKRAILGQQYAPELIDHVIADMSALEHEVAREADLSIGVTAGDAAVLAQYGAQNVLHAANGISPWSADPERRAAWRARLPQQPWAIFIASAHPPNYTGFLDAVGDTLACIPEGSRLVVAGGVGPHLARELAKSRWRDLNLARLQILGVLDDEDLAAVKSLAHAFLLPIGAGGGSNIKTAEALYSGQPVICTQTALRGFEHFADLPEVKVATTPAQFQAAIRAVLEAPPSQVAPAAAELRASLTWSACLAEVPVAVQALLKQAKATS